MNKAVALPSQVQAEPVEIHIHSMQMISFEADIEGHHGYMYPSMILGFTENQDITVGVPTLDGTEIPVPTGSRCTFQTTQTDGIRTFATRVLHRVDGAFPALVLAWPEGVVRMNRRDSVRIPARVLVDITFCRTLDETPVVLRGWSTDLSEGGMKLLAAESIPNGTYLSVRLHLPNTEDIHVCGGRVVRTGSSRMPGTGERQWVGVEFSNVSSSIQRNLRLYLWDVQRECLRKGIC
ncbi:hypothetical protein BH23GEM3_BH23GEM3_05010 [soil metagenome]